MKCTYCQGAISPTNKRAFEFGAVAVCSRDCWEALGMRLWRMHWKISYDPNQLSLGAVTDDVLLAAKDDLFLGAHQWAPNTKDTSEPAYSGTGKRKDGIDVT